MKEYKVKARTLDGSAVEEIIAAESEFDVGVIASEKGLFVTDIAVVQEKKARKKKSIKVKDLVVFCHQMAAMLNAGITTDKALNLVRMKAESTKLKEYYGRVYEEVQKGESVSNSLEQSGYFPKLFINMIRSGETTGDMGDTFQTMAAFYEKQAEMERKIKSAMIYPVILAILTVVITLVLVVFVLPGITESFQEQDVPGLTAALMSVSGFITSRWYILLGIVVALVFGIKELFKVDKIRIAFDKFKLKLPVVGKLLRTIYSARAASTISSLYAVGASMLVIVEETGGTLGNRYVEELFDDIYIKVSTGELLSKAMEETGIFDPMLYSMIEIGEEAGDLEVVLSSISKYFDNEATAATSQLVALIEPLMIIIMGIVVGVIVVAIMLPIISMGDIL